MPWLAAVPRPYTAPCYLFVFILSALRTLPLLQSRPLNAFIPYLNIFYVPFSLGLFTDKRVLLAFINVSMAKPRLDSLRPAASSSASTRRLKASTSVSSHPPNRSPRSRPARSRILPFLAALSATPLSIYAYPLDPTETSLPFLYPPFLHQPAPLAKRSVTPSTLNAATPSGSPPPASSSGCQFDKADLPDKYVVGEDGLWRKTHWSLYGSANCPVSKYEPLYRLLYVG